MQQDASSGQYLSDDTGRWGIALGALVTVQGRVGAYTDRDGDTVLQITAQQVLVLDDPNEEPCHWLHTISLHRSVYDTRRPIAMRPSVRADRIADAGDTLAGAADSRDAEATTSKASAHARLAEAAALVASCGRAEVTAEFFEDAFP